MIQSEFDRFVLAKAVRFSHGEFGFVVETFDDAGRNRAFGSEPVQQQRPMCRRLRATFFSGSSRERITRLHHSSRNRPAQVGD